MTAACKVLTTTNSALVTALAKCGGGNKENKPPPGFPQTGETTGHALNSAGVACPTKKSKNSKRMFFVTGQHCTHCGKDDQFHLPANCLSLPENAEKKALSDARYLIRQADKKA